MGQSVRGTLSKTAVKIGQPGQRSQTGRGTCTTKDATQFRNEINRVRRRTKSVGVLVTYSGGLVPMQDDSDRCFP
jgi:hypothetical protein